MPAMMDLTRAAALARLETFAPMMGRFYAANRNTERIEAADQTTSLLSPFLRRRLILEQEAVAAAHAANDAPSAEKFVQEVLWRSYFKGYLEARPELWSRYRLSVQAGRERLAAEPGLGRRYEAAIAGATGISGFDEWARALTARNWLHNHARMWFASIWIFTLRLPWALGADFFMRHLVDGDPASNTLSWRWVAGLHTNGKPYVARAENIRRYTDGRFSPQGLDESPDAIPDLLEEPPPQAARPIASGDRPPEREVALLLHLDDLHPESIDLRPARVVRVGGMVAHMRDTASIVRSADATAMADALSRAAAHFGCDAGEATGGWAAGLTVITPWAPVGPSAAMLPEGCLRIRRRWDVLTWPRATRGFFQMKAAIPELFREMGLS